MELRCNRNDFSHVHNLKCLVLLMCNLNNDFFYLINIVLASEWDSESDDETSSSSEDELVISCFIPYFSSSYFISYLIILVFKLGKLLTEKLLTKNLLVKSFQVREKHFWTIIFKWQNKQTLNKILCSDH